MKLWSKGDVASLIELYTDGNKEDLLKRFPNRTWRHIKSKANLLGLTRNTQARSQANSHPLDIEIRPTEDLGYFCGLVMGDGSLYANENDRGHYRICFISAEEELVRHFNEALKSISVELHPLIYYKEAKSTTPDGRHYFKPIYRVFVNSKILVHALWQYKNQLGKYRWTIPDFLTSEESLAGFLQGVFDAEGCVVFLPNGHKYPAFHRWIQLTSKHSANLESAQKALANFGITSRILICAHNRYAILKISRRYNLMLFLKHVGFRLKRKQIRLEEAISTYKESKGD